VSKAASVEARLCLPLQYAAQTACERLRKGLRA